MTGRDARRILLQRYGNGIPSWEFGVDPGKTDNALPFQASLNYARDHGGGRILLPVGLIKTSVPLILRSSATQLIGQGHAGSFNNNDGLANMGTVIQLTATGAAVLDVGDGTHIYNGIEVRGITFDAQYFGAGIRWNQGIIGSTFDNVHPYRTTKGIEILGTGATTSFGSRIINSTIEHFTQFGIDVYGDGNELLIGGNKFINTSGNSPQSSIRVGASEAANGVWIVFNGFGSTNVTQHIEAIESDNLTIFSNTLETSGNSSVIASSLIKLGDFTNTKKITNVNINDNRMLGNNKCVVAIVLDYVDGGVVQGNRQSGLFTGTTMITNNGHTTNLMVGNNILGVGKTLANSTTGFLIPTQTAG